MGLIQKFEKGARMISDALGKMDLTFEEALQAPNGHKMIRNKDAAKRATKFLQTKSGEELAALLSVDMVKALQPYGSHTPCIANSMFRLSDKQAAELIVKFLKDESLLDECSRNDQILDSLFGKIEEMPMSFSKQVFNAVMPKWPNRVNAHIDDSERYINWFERWEGRIRSSEAALTLASQGNECAPSR